MRPALLSLALLLLAAPAVAEDDDPTLRARSAVELFTRDYADGDPEKRMAALAELCEEEHELALRAIGSTGLVDPDPEVRGVAARCLGRMKGLAAQAGPLLRDRLMEDIGLSPGQIAQRLARLQEEGP